MRMILGLDRPTAGTRHGQRAPRTSSSPAPLHEVGRAAGRQGGAPRAVGVRPPAGAGGDDRHRPPPGRRGDRAGRPRRRWPASGSAASPSAWASGWASRRRCSATRRCSCWTSRSTASTRKASSGSATCCKDLAAEGRTVFVSCHLMSEMALTAEHLDRRSAGAGSSPTCRSRTSSTRRPARSVLVRSPQATQLRELLLADGVTVASSDPGRVGGHRPRPRTRSATAPPRRGWSCTSSLPRRRRWRKRSWR